MAAIKAAQLGIKTALVEKTRLAVRVYTRAVFQQRRSFIPQIFIASSLRQVNMALSLIN